MADNILSDFGINILEEEIDDVIFQTNEFLTDATFTGSQGPFWWILQMCMALAALQTICRDSVFFGWVKTGWTNSRAVTRIYLSKPDAKLFAFLLKTLPDISSGPA